MNRFQIKFNELNGKKAFVSYIMASDPDYQTSLDLMKAMPKAGVDIIELGMPFSDPTAEGPTIQKAALRALNAGGSIINTLKIAAEFRKTDGKTPIVLMGYYNPIFHFGCEKFVEESIKAGVDGYIIVDLPPEEEEEFTKYLANTKLSLIKLTTPTTDAARAKVILKNSSGFVYYVSVAGVTGVKTAVLDEVKKQVAQIKSQTTLPVCVGFGIKTPEQAKEMAEVADGIVIGSAFVNFIEANAGNSAKIISDCVNLATEVSKAVKSV
jgi:tryptophan synthase alpha chain